MQILTYNKILFVVCVCLVLEAVVAQDNPWRLEAGFVHIFAGGLMENAGKGDATCLYSSIVFTF